MPERVARPRRRLGFPWLGACALADSQQTYRPSAVAQLRFDSMRRLRANTPAETSGFEMVLFASGFIPLKTRKWECESDHLDVGPKTPPTYLPTRRLSRNPSSVTIHTPNARPS